jgi:hypothetical protein
MLTSHPRPPAGPLDERQKARNALQRGRQGYTRAVAEGRDPTYWIGSILRNQRRLAQPFCRPAAPRILAVPNRRPAGTARPRSRARRAPRTSRAGPRADDDPSEATALELHADPRWGAVSPRLLEVLREATA